MANAGQLGARIHNNAKGALAADANLINRIVANAINAASMQPARDFATGLTTGQAPAARVAPQTMAKSQQKATPAAGGAFVDLPGVGRVQMPSEAFLKANPMVPVQAPARAQPAAATSTTERAPAAAGGGFEDMIARFAQAAGGISLNELAALSDSSYKTTKSTPAAPKMTDILAQKYDALSEAMYQRAMAEAIQNKNLEKYDAANRQRLTELGIFAKANPIEQNLGPQFAGRE